nr:hypothetical protein Iba_chr15dCG0390 [Ipomoea batatas]
MVVGKRWVGRGLDIEDFWLIVKSQRGACGSGQVVAAWRWSLSLTSFKFGHSHSRLTMKEDSSRSENIALTAAAEGKYRGGRYCGLKGFAGRDASSLQTGPKSRAPNIHELRRDQALQTGRRHSMSEVLPDLCLNVIILGLLSFLGVGVTSSNFGVTRPRRHTARIMVGLADTLGATDRAPRTSSSLEELICEGR